MQNNSSDRKIRTSALVLVGALVLLSLVVAGVAMVFVITKPPPPPPQPTAAVIANDTPVLVAPSATPTGKLQVQPLPTYPVSHPAGTSGRCFDGTYTSEEHKQTACLHNDGVVVWWGP